MLMSSAAWLSAHKQVIIAACMSKSRHAAAQPDNLGGVSQRSAQRAPSV